MDLCAASVPRDRGKMRVGGGLGISRGPAETATRDFHVDALGRVELWLLLGDPFLRLSHVLPLPETTR